MKHTTTPSGFLMLALLLLLGGGMAQGQHADHSLLASGTWYKLSLKESGIYKLTTAELGALEGRRTANLALYGHPGGMLPERNGEARPDDLLPMPVEIHDLNDNGLFDADDYLLFYGEGAERWVYNSSMQQYEYRRHAYETENYCFLRLDAPQVRHVDTVAMLADNGEATIETYTAVAHHEQELVNTHQTGQIWVGEAFAPTLPSLTIAVDMPTPEAGTEMILQYGLASVSNRTTRFDLTFGSTSTSIAFPAGRPYQSGRETATANGNTPTVSLTFSGSSDDRGYLDYLSVNLTAPLRFSGPQMPIRNLQHLGSGLTARFVMRNAPSNVRLWDVSQYDSVHAVPLTRAEGNVSFTLPTEAPATLVAFDGTAFLTPTSATELPNQDLHGAANPQLVIVTHPTFRPQAQQLASLHTIMDNMETLVVTDQEVYNEFSSGRQDPMAIREMMRMFMQRHTANPTSTTKPQYLLLFGKGTYDPRNLSGHNLPSVVTYVSAQSFSDESDSYCSDDLFGYLDDGESGYTNEALDLGIGRLPAKSSTEASHFVEKIQRYMTRADLAQEGSRGDWRNYVALLADDADPSAPGDTIFATSSEYLANTIALQYPHINVDKIYADAYMQQSGAIGSYYPDVDNAIKQRLDYGCLLLNYIGHGSALYIGTERYIEPHDISNYQNTDRLTFLVTSTCSFGRYDNPTEECGAELFLLAEAAGVGVISAGRPIAHIRRFNTDLCTFALDPSNTVGDALRMAKNRTSVSHSIALIGDPAMKLSHPQHRIAATHINEQPVQAGRPDSAAALSSVTIEGEIQDETGARVQDFSGVIYPIVFDRATTAHTLANDNAGTEVAFSLQKNILYRGLDTVVEGRFRYQFVVPRDVLYQYDFGRLSHYAKTSDGIDASGAYSNLLFGGFDESAMDATCRPTVRLFIGDSTFRNGGMTHENPDLFVMLSDSIGINVGTGLGHDITAILDGNAAATLVLNDFYETDLVDSRRGTIRYSLSGLQPGPHTLTVKAWNIYNLSGTATLTFHVYSSDTAQVGDFVAYPNPASDHVTLHLEHNAAEPIAEATFIIYDMQAREVCRLHPTIAPNSFVAGPVTWHFTGNGSNCPVPNGIYFARAILTTTRGNTLTAVTKIVKAKQ